MTGQPFEGHEAYIPLAPDERHEWTDRALRTLRLTALRFGMIPECQPAAGHFDAAGVTRLTTTGYLLTCQTCGAEQTTDQPGRIVHLDAGHHEYQPD